jgi:hypothetical protein
MSPLFFSLLFAFIKMLFGIKQHHSFLLESNLVILLSSTGLCDLKKLSFAGFLHQFRILLPDL